MRHLSNISDPKNPEARMYFTEYTYEQWLQGAPGIDAAWKSHLEWVNKNVVGPPQATETYSVEQLQAMGMVGVYENEK